MNVLFQRLSLEFQKIDDFPKGTTIVINKDKNVYQCRNARTELAPNVLK